MPYPPTTTQAPNKPLSQDHMYALAYNAGWRGQDMDIALAVAKAESGWVPNATNRNSNGSIDRGLWQINSVHTPPTGPYVPDQLLNDPQYNANAAFNISGGGTKWSAWTTFNSGAYRKYLTANAAQNFPGSPGLSPLSGQGGLGGIAADLKATVSRLVHGDPPVQSAFDPNMQYASGPFASATTKGQIIGQSPPAEGYVVKFLYNPAEIAFDYSVDTNVKDPTQQDVSQMLVGLPQGTSTQLNFQLYFDRTFECKKGSQVGVLTDIRALEWLCGITPDFPFMLPNRVKIMFGASSQLTWNAYILGLGVKYQFFNSAMIPMRCVVDVRCLRMGPDAFKGAADPALQPTKAKSSTKQKQPFKANTNGTVSVKAPGGVSVDVDPIVLSGGA